MSARLAELATIGTLLVMLGAALVYPGIAAEARAAAVSAIVGGLLLVARIFRRRE